MKSANGKACQTNTNSPDDFSLTENLPTEGLPDGNSSNADLPSANLPTAGLPDGNSPNQASPTTDMPDAQSPSGDSPNASRFVIYTIERIEGTIALCEDENGQLCRFACAQLPSGLREGLRLGFDGTCWTLLEADTARKKALFDKKRKLLERG